MMRALLLLRRLVAHASREAVLASPARNVAKTLAQSALFWSVFLLILPRVILKIERGLLPGPSKYLSSQASRRVGQILFACGSALGLWSGITMALRGKGTPLPLDAPRELVVAGPYRRLRNPMAVSGVAQGVAVGLASGGAVCAVRRAAVERGRAPR